MSPWRDVIGAELDVNLTEQMPPFMVIDYIIVVRETKWWKCIHQLNTISSSTTSEHGLIKPTKLLVR